MVFFIFFAKRMLFNLKLLISKLTEISEKALSQHSLKRRPYEDI